MTRYRAISVWNGGSQLFWRQMWPDIAILMGIDEEGTHKDLKAHCHELVEPKIRQHRGRILKNTGDGFLAEFTSVLDAVRCATEIQQGMTERNAKTPDDRRIDFRLGVHQGDIITDSGDIFGDGVNVAARLEGIADPGGICVSGRVEEDVRGKLDLALDDIGEQQLKNIERPVRVYRIRMENKATRSRPVLALPDRPSIAVLPFQNMSGDPEQDYFADGVVEEIITALSRFRQLFVIARNSSFTYKGRSIDVRQVGRELGVRYVLEGSVRRAANRVRRPRRRGHRVRGVGMLVWTEANRTVTGRNVNFCVRPENTRRCVP